MKKLQDGDNAGAERSFKAYLQANPKGALAGNAQYWLGESYYARRDYQNAMTAFAEGYKTYKTSPKGPDNLLKLGPGRHYGEWWGHGIQRNYSQTRKRFSLFNVSRWRDDAVRPTACDVVPVLYEGPLEEYGVLKGVKSALARLQQEGSVAAPGFMKPEGIVIFHAQANLLFKKTLERDDEWKGKQTKAA